MRQECARKVEDVLSERYGLQRCLNSPDLKLLGAGNTLTVAHKQLWQHRESLTASRFWLESLLISLLSRFINRLARLVKDEEHAYRERVL